MGVSVPDVTYNVFGGTLNLALSIYLCGWTFFLKKLTFLVVVFKTHAKTAELTTPPPSNSYPPSKNILTNFTSCSAWGTLTTYLHKLSFFLGPRGARAPSVTARLRACLPATLEIVCVHKW